MTILEQLQKSGIRRVGARARGFKYKVPLALKQVTADLKRIDELKIPPAWSDVWINAAAGGVVQAIGRDAEGIADHDGRYQIGRAKVRSASISNDPGGHGWPLDVDLGHRLTVYLLALVFAEQHSLLPSRS